VTHGEWGQNPDSMLEMYYDPVIKEFPDDPHIFRKYEGEKELIIEVRKVANVAEGNFQKYSQLSEHQ